MSVKSAFNAFVLVGLLFSFGIFAFSQTTKKAPQNAARKALSAQEIATRFLPSVVMIICEDGKGKTSQGSGFFIDGDRILTNYHVVKGMVRGKVKLVAPTGVPEEWRVAEVAAVDMQNDLALLLLPWSSGVSNGRPIISKEDQEELTRAPTPREADENKRHLQQSRQVELVAVRKQKDKIQKLVMSSSVPRTGEEIYVLSNPEGLLGTISRGIVSGGTRTIKGISLLQIDAPISAGSSGGPVLNVYGEVVGVATGSFLAGQNLNFAVPSSSIRSMLAATSERRNLSTSQNQPSKAIDGWLHATPEYPKTSSSSGSGSGLGSSNAETRRLWDTRAAERPTDKEIEFISVPRATYTDEARKNKIRGTVVLRISFLASGSIGRIVTVKSLPKGLTESAIKAARNIYFSPAIRNKINITVVKSFEYRFTEF